MFARKLLIGFIIGAVATACVMAQAWFWYRVHHPYSLMPGPQDKHGVAH